MSHSPDWKPPILKAPEDIKQCEYCLHVSHTGASSHLCCDHPKAEYSNIVYVRDEETQCGPQARWFEPKAQDPR